jgi:LPP20 lipoprotein
MGRTTLLVSLVVFAAAVGCHSHKQKASTKPQPVPKIDAPGWYKDPPRDNDRLLGVATATSQDLQTAIDKAKQDARVEIARQLDLRVKGLSKRFVEETGLNEDAELLGMFSQVSKTVVSDSLNGTRMAKQELDHQKTSYQAYVMMEMPIGEANSRFLEKIRSHERLHTRVRATKAFEELDREVEAYEEWKRKQASGDER